MSIQHLETAAETRLHATSKLVLMALCDDANKITRLAYPGMPKLVEWSGARERRVQGILEELIAEQYIARKSFGYPGHRAEYIVFPSPEEIDALDAINPDLNRVSALAMNRVHAANAARAEQDRVEGEKVAQLEAKRAAKAAAREARRAAKEPVEEEEECMQPVAGTNQKMGATEPENMSTGCTPPVISPPVNTSHVGNSHQGAVENARIDDEEFHHPTPLDVARAKKLTIDYPAIREALVPLAIEVTVTDTIAGLAARRVMRRAAGSIANPTGLVLTAIRNPADRIDWQNWLLGVENDIAAAEAEAGGNPF